MDKYRVFFWKFHSLIQIYNFRDVVSIQQDGNVDIITQHREDLIFDKIGRLVEHWRVERLVAQTSQQIRGIQVFF